MGFVSSTTVARLRALNDAALPFSAVVEVPATTKGAGGQRTETWATVGQGIPCRIEPSGNPDEQAIADRMQVTAAVVLVFPAGTVVPTRARVTVSGDRAGVAFVRRFQAVAASPFTVETQYRVVAGEMVT